MRILSILFHEWAQIIWSLRGIFSYETSVSFSKSEHYVIYLWQSIANTSKGLMTLVTMKWDELPCPNNCHNNFSGCPCRSSCRLSMYYMEHLSHHRRIHGHWYRCCHCKPVRLASVLYDGATPCLPEWSTWALPCGVELNENIHSPGHTVDVGVPRPVPAVIILKLPPTHIIPHVSDWSSIPMSI